MKKPSLSLLILALIGALILPSCHNIVKPVPAGPENPSAHADPLDPIRPDPGKHGTDASSGAASDSSFESTSDIPSEKTSDAASEKTSDAASGKTSEKTSDHEKQQTGQYFFPVENDAVTLKEGSAPAGYLADTVFYGDSTTYGLAYYKMFGSKATKQVWTPKSGTLALFNAATEKIYDRVEDTERSLADMAAYYKPKYLVITLGINGVSMMKEDYFKQEYQKVIDIIRVASPDTKIILQTMYPICSTYEGKITRETVLKGNRWIHDLAVKNALPFLNSYNHFLDTDQYMAKKYENGGDGIHFNEDGYARMLGFFENHPAA